MCEPLVMARRREEELVAGLSHHDECALEEIDRRYRRQLRSHAQRLLAGTGVDPDDLVQDTVLRAWTRPPRRDVALGAWLHVVLRNRGVDLLRAPVVARAAGAAVDADRAAPGDVHEQAAQRERVRALVQAIQDLPPRQARALVLHAMEGRPHAAIAAELGGTPQGAKALVHRARSGLASVR